VGLVCIEIVEGNPHLRSLLGWHLQQLEYRVFQAASIYQGREVFITHQPTLVILDADLPDGNGIEFCKWLHRQQQPLILMLSGKNNESDIVAGLKAGADDYMSKPFGMQEFLARVEALIRRRRTPQAPAYLDYGPLQIDLVQRRARFKGEFIDLTPQEFSLLYVLAQAGGVPLSRSELLRRAWPDAIDNPRTIDTHVLSLRKKVELDPRQPSLIQTIRNVGYRLNVELLNSSTPNSRQSAGDKIPTQKAR
jgi:two-component system, OmpR family, response regulator